MLNTSSPEDRNCVNLSLEFYPILHLLFFILEIYCDTAFHFCALNSIKILWMLLELNFNNDCVCVCIYIYIYNLCFYVDRHFLKEIQQIQLWFQSLTTKPYLQIKVKLVTVVKGNQKAPFSIAITPRCRGGCYSFPWIVPFYPWYVPFIAEC